MSLYAKEVDYKTYCRKCKHRHINPAEDPCDECMSTPAQEESRVPIHFEEDKTINKKG